jgi:hypothetical protein
MTTDTANALLYFLFGVGSSGLLLALFLVLIVKRNAHRKK